MDTKIADLANIIKDSVAFLNDLNAVLPNKVSQELLDFLNGLDHSWLVELLANNINTLRANKR
jgi:hypothetical protein